MHINLSTVLLYLPFLDDDDDDDDDEEEIVEQDEPEVQSSEPGYTGFSLLEGDFLGDLLGTSGQKKKKTSSTKRPGDQPHRKNAVKKISHKQSTLTLPKVSNKNVTVSKNKNKADDTSDEIAEIVESIVSGDDDESIENDDEEDDIEDEDDSKETKAATEGICTENVLFALLTPFIVNRSY